MRPAETIEEIMKLNPEEIFLQNDLTGARLWWTGERWVISYDDGVSPFAYQGLSLVEAFEEFNGARKYVRKD